MSNVLVFHNGDIGGDCSELSIAVDDLTQITTFKRALKLITAESLARELYDFTGDDLSTDFDVEGLEEDVKELKEEFKGVYVVDADTYNKYTNALSQIGIGGDSTAYTVQSVLKALAKEFSVKSFGTKIAN